MNYLTERYCWLCSGRGKIKNLYSSGVTCLECRGTGKVYKDGTGVDIYGIMEDVVRHAYKEGYRFFYEYTEIYGVTRIIIQNDEKQFVLHQYGCYKSKNLENDLKDPVTMDIAMAVISAIMDISQDNAMDCIAKMGHFVGESDSGYKDGDY